MPATTTPAPAAGGIRKDDRVQQIKTGKTGTAVQDQYQAAGGFTAVLVKWDGSTRPATPNDVRKLARLASTTPPPELTEDAGLAVDDLVAVKPLDGIKGRITRVHGGGRYTVLAPPATQGVVWLRRELEPVAAPAEAPADLARAQRAGYDTTGWGRRRVPNAQRTPTGAPHTAAPRPATAPVPAPAEAPAQDQPAVSAAETDAAVVAALAAAHAAAPHAWATGPQLAARAGLSTKQVRRAMRRLVAAGHAVVDKSHPGQLLYRPAPQLGRTAPEADPFARITPADG